MVTLLVVDYGGDGVSDGGRVERGKFGVFRKQKFSEYVTLVAVCCDGGGT
jgi:hypothetical protein